MVSIRMHEKIMCQRTFVWYFAGLVHRSRNVPIFLMGRLRPRFHIDRTQARQSFIEPQLQNLILGLLNIHLCLWVAAVEFGAVGCRHNLFVGRIFGNTQVTVQLRDLAAHATGSPFLVSAGIPGQLVEEWIEGTVAEFKILRLEILFLAAYR